MKSRNRKKRRSENDSTSKSKFAANTNHNANSQGGNNPTSQSDGNHAGAENVQAVFVICDGHADCLRTWLKLSKAQQIRLLEIGADDVADICQVFRNFL